VTTPPSARGPRLREHGVRIGRFSPGAQNAITDVPGVAVGHVTVWRDEPEPPEGRGVARTGITAVLPHSQAELLREAAPAGGAVLNGAGEMTGFIELSEWGTIRTPVYLTSTHAVGRVYDGAVAAAVAADPAVGVERVVIPVVAECDDSDLSEARVVHVEAADVARALEVASSGAVDEGAVGAGGGMIAFGYKGGIGTASRLLPSGGTVGVLVLANFGVRPQLRIDGVRVGEILGGGNEESESGSCIAVVATDAPLSGHELGRVARRAGLGLARTGSAAHHGSGEIFVAFSTATPAKPTAGDVLNEVFAATVEATEESVLNALWAAPGVQGRAGRVVPGLPHDDVLELLARHGRLDVR
jgi:D-aminopeptidase